MGSLCLCKKVDPLKSIDQQSFVPGSLFERYIRRFITIVCVLIYFFPSPVRAMDLSTKSEIEKLKKRIERLEGEAAEEEKVFTLGTLSKYIEFSGVIEADAYYSKTSDGPETSDIVLSTLQLGTEINYKDTIGGHVVLLHEEDETETLEIDEGYIRYTQPFDQRGQFVAVAGKFYLPFGNFHSAMLTDPLTLELAETNKSALQFNYESERYEVYAAVFNGETDAVGSRDNIDSIVAAFQVKPSDKLSFGAYFINDLAESDNGLVADPADYDDSVSGTGGYLSMGIGKFSLNLEHITALESFENKVFDGDLSGPKPRAWSVELGYIPADKLGMALRYEKANDFKEDFSRYGGVFYYTIFDNTIWALEYLLEDPKYTESDTYIVTTRLALGF